MGRTKKDVAVAAEAEGTVDLIPPVEAGDEVKKGRPAGKRKGKEVTSSENSPPKRTLRSNSKTSLVVAPVEKEVVAEEKKGRKAPVKSKKVEEVNTDSDASSENTDAPAVNGNGLLKSKTENGVASVEEVQGDKAEKGAKGRKKNEKTAPAVNGETLKETEKKETKQTDDSETLKNDNTDKEKSKPVKAANAKGKKKAESKTVQADSEEVTSEPEAPVIDKEEELKEKEKAASGKGKKKAEKKEEEVVAPKKTKKEAPAKPAKGAKGTEAEETKEEKEVKPAAGETKKAAGKPKSAKAKEVAIEHWNAERVKKILAPFCNPSVVFSTNSKSTPRRGAFEIIVVNDDDEEQVMWSGLKLGPPRKEKFPSDEKLEELATTFFSD